MKPALPDGKKAPILPTDSHEVPHPPSVGHQQKMREQGATPPPQDRVANVSGAVHPEPESLDDAVAPLNAPGTTASELTVHANKSVERRRGGYKYRLCIGSRRADGLAVEAVIDHVRRARRSSRYFHVARAHRRYSRVNEHSREQLQNSAAIAAAITQLATRMSTAPTTNPRT